MISRRALLHRSAAFAAALPIASLAHAAEPRRPNILWIFGDDLGIELGCYGHPLVQTPTLDRLAADGVRYANAFTTAPVCSASRSALITGMYATSIGAHHHRSHRDDNYRLPGGVQLLTDLFRQAGYFTANLTAIAPGLRASGKTDFNFSAPRPFDGNNWSQLRPNQPFYAQVNFSEPHRGAPPDVWSRTRTLARNRINPDKVTLPPYYADHPLIRRDWAEYLDAIAVLDDKVDRLLRRLEQDNLADNTIILFLGDNGRCHFRDKQFLYDGGIHVPLILRDPRSAARGVDDRLVSGIDLPATSLALAGLEPPRWMQGRIFAGPSAAPPRTHIIAARDRCDETVDRIRCVRTARYKYIRNFMPDRPWSQPNKYKETSYPALPLMRRLHAEGKLTPAQSRFFAPARPPEELYDLSSDPHELTNLAPNPAHAITLGDLRKHLDRWIAETADQGTIPEPVLPATGA